jgi:hypothetical protein
MVGASFTVAAVAQVLRSKKGITAVGNAQVSTAQSYFGGSSLLMDGSGDRLNVIGEVLESQYTVEYWFRASSFSNGPTLVDFRGGGNDNYSDYITSGGVFTVFINSADRIQTSALSTNTWYHIAVVRDSSSDIKLYLNGTKTGVTYNQASYSLNTSWYIGDNFLFVSSLNGYMDEIRVSKTARYTTNFSVATAPFVNDANTVLLIHANGTNASTFFEDDNGTVRSQNDFRLLGNARISTSRSKFGGSSAYFDGSGDYAISANSITFADNQNFTWEFWVNEDVSQGCKYIGGQIQNDIFIGHDPNAFSNRLGVGVVSVGWYMDFGETLALDTWYHLCVQRSGDTVYGYINGVLKVTHTGTLANWDWHWRNVVLGAETTGNTPFNGYLDEMRWSNIVRYATAGFTQPTEPFVNDSNTVLLVHADGTNASTVVRDDNGITGFSPKTIGVAGNAQISTAQSYFGGSSALFDGTDDYIRLGSNGLDDYYFGTRDFTIEFWFRTSAKTRDYPMLIGNTDNGNFTTDRWQLFDRHLANATKVILYIWNYSNSTPILTSTTSISNNTWYHLAITRNGSLFTLWVNGVSESTGTFAGAIDSSGRFISIGGNESAAVISYNGNIDEVRISNSCRYTAAFTPATAPFTSDSNTISLLHMDGANASTTFRDDAGRTQKGIQAIGNTNVSTTQSKFGGSSAYFDGTGDYLTVADNASLTFAGDHTIECWIRLNATPGFPSNNTIYHSNFLFYLAYYNNGGAFYELDVFLGGQNQVSTSGSGSLSLSTNTWYHIAFVKNSGNYKIFLDGVIRANTNYDAQLVSQAGNYVGGSPVYGSTNWFIDEYRISNTARYTAAFTPPTAPFQNDDNTVLLIHADGTNGSTAFFDDNGVKPTTA